MANHRADASRITFAEVGLDALVSHPRDRFGEREKSLRRWRH